ncbi:MAG: DUF4031 domain-containing protein, partial [Janthinobacterium lividum]
MEGVRRRGPRGDLARAARQRGRRLEGRAALILVDLPTWPAHGRLWSHLASDTSYAELHAFAERLGLASRAFDG